MIKYNGVEGPVDWLSEKCSYRRSERYVSNHTKGIVLTGKIKWLKDNWPWLLPMAAISAFFPLTICILTTILSACFLVIKSSKIYRQTVKTVRNNDKVVELLGSPVQPGLLVMGNINRGVAGITVNLSVPFIGPHGHATAFVVAQKEDKEWRFITLQVQCREGGGNVDLLVASEVLSGVKKNQADTLCRDKETGSSISQ